MTISSPADSSPSSGSTTPAPVAIAGTGESIPHPLSGKTYAVTDGTRTVAVPEGMVYIPASAFTMGSGTTAHTVGLSAYCIGKFAVTNAEYKAFIDATGRAAPRASQESAYGSYWDSGTSPAGKGAAPVCG